jgi:hypothetical protein
VKLILSEHPLTTIACGGSHWTEASGCAPGESDEAFKWLDRAYEQKDTLLYGIKFAPEFDKLHEDARYKAF